MHLPAPTTGTDPHEQQWFWMPQTGHNRYDCRYICPLTQYGLECGHKLSDSGLVAMTALKDQGTRKGERSVGEGKGTQEPSPRCPVRDHVHRWPAAMGKVTVACETAVLCRCPRFTRSQTAASDIHIQTSTFMPSAGIPVHVRLGFVCRNGM